MSTAADLQPLYEHIVKLLKSGRSEQAEQQTRAILQRLPGEPNAVFLLAKARHQRGAGGEAVQLLDGLLARQRDWLSVHQEKAVVLHSMGELAAAVGALREVVRLDPGRAPAWGLMAQMLSTLGDEAAANTALEAYFKAAARPEVLVEAAARVASGNLVAAESLCREYLRQVPGDVDALRLLAEIATRLGVFEEAETLFARCLSLAPAFLLARAGYAHVLMKQGKFERSLEHIEQLLISEPHNSAYRVLWASVLVRIGRHEEAIEAYRSVVGKPEHSALDVLSLGHALKTIGRTAEAIDAYRQAIVLDPLFGEAYWSLANLKTFEFSDDDLSAMRVAAASKRCKTRERPALHFALGKALEDRGEYREAFMEYERGNTLRRKELRYSADDNHARTRELMQVCTRDLFEHQAGAGCADAAPIFIVGLPRSGSTLVEQILASHSQVDGTAELPDIIDLARRLSGKRKPRDPSHYPRILHELSGSQLRELGEEYLARTRIQRRGAPYFIDKMPNNFAHIGLIHLILPNAKIIDARRHPLACCFSAYKQLFATGQNFSYDLTELGRYYADYVELMAHWDQVLPQRVLRVFYEATVADTEAAVRRLLDHCGLPFEQGCLRFYATERAVRTASSEQVRRPIYRGAVEHWQHFEPFLGPLQSALSHSLHAGALP